MCGDLVNSIGHLHALFNLSRQCPWHSQKKYLHGDERVQQVTPAAGLGAENSFTIFVFA